MKILHHNLPIFFTSALALALLGTLHTAHGMERDLTQIRAQNPVQNYVDKLNGAIAMESPADFGAVVFDLYDMHGHTVFFSTEQKNLLHNFVAGLKNTKDSLQIRTRFEFHVKELLGETYSNRYKRAHEEASQEYKVGYGTFGKTTPSAEFSQRKMGFVPQGLCELPAPGADPKKPHEKQYIKNIEDKIAQQRRGAYSLRIGAVATLGLATLGWFKRDWVCTNLTHLTGLFSRWRAAR